MVIPATVYADFILFDGKVKYGGSRFYNWY